MHKLVPILLMSLINLWTIVAASKDNLGPSSTLTKIKIEKESSFNIRTAASSELLKFSHDDMMVLISDGYGNADLWDCDRGQHIFSIKRNSSNLKYFKFSHDNTKIIFQYQTKTTIINAKTGAVLETLGEDVCGYGPLQNCQYVYASSFSHDSTRLATAMQDNSVRVRNFNNNILSLKGHKKKINSVAFSEDDKRIITTSEDKNVIIWSADRGEILSTFSDENSYLISAKISHNGQLVLGQTGDHRIIVWSIKTRERLLESRPISDINSIKFNKKDDQIEVRCKSKWSDKVTFHRWDIRSGHIHHSRIESDYILTMGRGGISKISKSRFGKSVYFQNSKSKIKFYRPPLGCEYGGEAIGSALNHGETKAIIITRGGDVLLFDLLSNKMTSYLSLQNGSDNVHFDDNNTKVFISSIWRSGILWNLKDGQPIHHFGPILFGEISHHNNMVLVIPTNSTSAELISTDTGKIIHRFSLRKLYLFDDFSLFSHNDDLIYLQDKYSSYIWDTSTGKLLAHFSDYKFFHDGLPYIAAKFSHNDNMIVISPQASRDFLVVHDSRSGKKISTIKGARNELRFFTFSQDDTKIITQSYGQKSIDRATVWNVQSGKKLYTKNIQSINANLRSELKKLKIRGDERGSTIYNTHSGEALYKLDFKGKFSHDRKKIFNITNQSVEVYKVSF